MYLERLLSVYRFSGNSQWFVLVIHATASGSPAGRLGCSENGDKWVKKAVELLVRPAIWHCRKLINARRSIRCPTSSRFVNFLKLNHYLSLLNAFSSVTSPPPIGLHGTLIPISIYSIILSTIGTSRTAPNDRQLLLVKKRGWRGGKYSSMPRGENWGKG